ncbi:MAG: TIGR03435 family protein [Acidobacteriota bacterium]
MTNSKGVPTWTSPNGMIYRLELQADGGYEVHESGFTFEEFAYHLNNLDGLDIVDATGISGRFDFVTTNTALEACEPCKTPPPPPPLGAARTPGTKESLAKLGLRLEKRKAKVDVFVIDSVDRIPSEN